MKTFKLLCQYWYQLDFAQYFGFYATANNVSKTIEKIAKKHPVSNFFAKRLYVYYYLAGGVSSAPSMWRKG